MKKYENGFKKKACELLYTERSTPTKISKNLNIPVKTFEKWVKLYREDKTCFNEDYESLEEENKRLKYTIKRLRETIEILKKAKAFSLTEKMHTNDLS